MASRKQLEANRLNAKRSTGPKSADGKARSNKNSLAHGLTARDVVVGDEDPEAFERLRSGLHADFKPTSTVELELVERLAGLFWRLRRIPVLEGALLDAMQEENASTENDFTLHVTPEQQRVLMYVWYDLQNPEYQQFLTKFFGTTPPTLDDAKEMSSIPIPASVEIGKHVDLNQDDAVKYPKTRKMRLRIPEPDEESRRSIRTGLALIKDAEKHDVLGKLSRYEASLANAVARTLSLLHSIQTSGLVANDRDENRHR